jgi:hypothetical protein
MDISSIGKPLQESASIHAIRGVNHALCSVVMLLTSRSLAKRSLSFRACSRLTMFIAQQSRELLKAELLLNKPHSAFIQRSTVRTIDSSLRALYALRDQFVFDDTDVQEVVMSPAMCGNIVSVIDQLIDVLSYDIQQLTVKGGV